MSVFETSSFTRAERGHLTILQERLDYLRDGNHQGEPGIRAGEANALAWALAVLEGAAMTARVERLERWRRTVEQRLGAVETWVKEADDDAE